MTGDGCPIALVQWPEGNQAGAAYRPWELWPQSRGANLHSLRWSPTSLSRSTNAFSFPHEAAYVGLALAEADTRRGSLGSFSGPQDQQLPSAAKL